MAWRTLAVLLALPLVACAGGSKTTTGTAMAAGVEQSMHDQMDGIVTLNTARLHVDCPTTIPLRKGYVFDCALSGYPYGHYQHVRVTEEDDTGRFSFEVY